MQLQQLWLKGYENSSHSTFFQHRLPVRAANLYHRNPCFSELSKLASCVFRNSFSLSIALSWSCLIQAGFLLSIIRKSLLNFCIWHVAEVPFSRPCAAGLFPSWPRSIVLEQLLQSGSYRYDLYRYARSLWTASSNQDAAKRFCKLHNLEVLQ